MLHSRTRRPLLLSLVSLGLAGLVVWVAQPTRAASADPVPAPATSDLAVALIRAGLDAPALAAAGLSSGEVSSVVAAAEAEIAANPSALADADSAYASSNATCTVLERKIRSGLAAPEEVSSYQHESTVLVQAKADRDAALGAIFAAGIGKLSAAKQQTLQTIRGNRHWKLLVPYLVVDRTDATWVELRDALDARRIAEEPGAAELDPAAAAFLADVESDPAVSQAIASHDTSLASVQTAWNAAASD